jgi:hypothetical protein
MEVYEANVIKKDGQHILELSLKGKKVEIPLTEDKPDEIKSVFNELIVELKKGEFNFKLKNKENNLYQQISNEYIKQLNNELHSVYNELDDYGLLE